MEKSQKTATQKDLVFFLFRQNNKLFFRFVYNILLKNYANTENRF